MPSYGCVLSLHQRFWYHVGKKSTEECWEWTGKKNKQGYGRIRTESSGNHQSLAPRVSWEIHFGKIPDNLFVLHRCDNPSCVNPSHLFLGTIADNNNDRDTKGRTRCALGESNKKSKLTEDAVVQIRALALEGYKPRELSLVFGVGTLAIERVLSGRTWSHVRSQQCPNYQKD